MPNVSFSKTPACLYITALGVFVSLFSLDLCLAQSTRDTSPSVEPKSLIDLRSSLLIEIDSLKDNPSWLVAEVGDRVSSAHSTFADTRCQACAQIATQALDNEMIGPG